MDNHHTVEDVGIAMGRPEGCPGGMVDKSLRSALVPWTRRLHDGRRHIGAFVFRLRGGVSREGRRVRRVDVVKESPGLCERGEAEPSRQPPQWKQTSTTRWRAVFKSFARA